jgi:hypothetical protein
LKRKIKMSSPVVSVSAVGFFTFWMFWTLNGASGKDMNDVVVDYWQAQAEATE